LATAAEPPLYTCDAVNISFAGSSKTTIIKILFYKLEVYYVKRRQLILTATQCAGILALQSCGSGKSKSFFFNDSTIKVKNIAGLRLMEPQYNGQQFEVLGHTFESQGGGLFYFDGEDHTSVDDNGSIIVGGENRYRRVRPLEPTAEMFGARVNLEADQSTFINKCMEVYGACFLEGGKTYNIYNQVTATILKTYGSGLATLNCVSLTNDKKFGIGEAAVYSAGNLYKPLAGVDIQNISINCNELFSSGGDVGVKGFWFHRCEDFLQKNCVVSNSAYSAYLDSDDITLDSIFCHGFREACRANDSYEAFRQINVLDVTLSKCSAHISTNTLSYIPQSLFHPQGGNAMKVILNNCSGVVDGACLNIFLGMINCNNVSANDCTFINNYNGNFNTVINFEGEGGNFDNIVFEGCTIKSKHSPAAFLDVGENASNNAKIKFINCKIEGYQIGVQINGIGGTYSFTECDTTGVANEALTPYAYFQNGPLVKDGAVVRVIGGSATAEGVNAITTTNMSKFIYTNTLLTPPDFSAEPVINVKNINELRNMLPKYDKQQFNVLGYAREGIGGGVFYYDASDSTAVDDGGSVIVGNGNRFKRVRTSMPTAEMFGAGLDPEADQSVFINNCTKAYGECYLEGGSVYNIYYEIGAIILKTYGSGTAVLNCISPTNNNSFGSYSAVTSKGSFLNPLLGVDIQNIKINCNSLVGHDGNVGLKGFWLYRCQDFYQKGCTVINSASYAYWDHDDSETGTTYCSGVRESCWAIDCSVSFEQVNVRGVTLNNCHGYISNSTLPYPIECIFHPYGGSDMQVVYNNCTGVSDGDCPAVLLALLKCKNVTANDCSFVNNHDGGGHTRTAVYFNNSGGDFDNFMFRNCILKSSYSPAAYLDVGARGSESSIFKFTDCIVEGFQLGVQINGIGGFYSFVNCNTKGVCDLSATPFAYYLSGASARDKVSLRVIGGSAVAEGPNARATTNVDKYIYTDTLLTPAGLVLPKVRQEIVGSGNLSSNVTYAYLTIRFPMRIVDPTKVVISAMINATGALTGVEAVSWSTPLSWISLDDTNFRLYAPVEFAERTVNYVMTEYE